MEPWIPRLELSAERQKAFPTEPVPGAHIKNTFVQSGLRIKPFPAERLQFVVGCAIMRLAHKNEMPSRCDRSFSVKGIANAARNC